MLKVNPKFENLFAPLSPEEYAGLEQDIIATNGPREAIVVWNDTIVDGHHRYAICQKHDLPFMTREETFSSEAEAIAWMIKEQFHRRNMSPVARTIAALNAKEALIEVGRQKHGLRKDMADAPHNTRKLIAEKAGVSDSFVYQVDYVLQHGEDKLQQAMISEEMSVGQAYSIARKADEKLERKKQRREEARKSVMSPVNDGDASPPVPDETTQAVEDESLVDIPKEWTEFRRLSSEEREEICRQAKENSLLPEVMARIVRIQNEADAETLEKLKCGEMNADDVYEALAANDEITSSEESLRLPMVGIEDQHLIPNSVQLDDTPESFRYVMDLVQRAVDNFVALIQNAMSKLSPGMLTNQNKASLEDAIRAASQLGMRAFSECMSELGFEEYQFENAYLGCLILLADFKDYAKEVFNQIGKMYTPHAAAYDLDGRVINDLRKVEKASAKLRSEMNKSVTQARQSAVATSTTEQERDKNHILSTREM